MKIHLLQDTFGDLKEIGLYLTRALDIREKILIFIHDPEAEREPFHPRKTMKRGQPSPVKAFQVWVRFLKELDGANRYARAAKEGGFFLIFPASLNARLNEFTHAGSATAPYC